MINVVCKKKSLKIRHVWFKEYNQNEGFKKTDFIFIMV